MKRKKYLVAYFSASGVTRKLAGILARVTGADLYEIRPETPYTSADLNWSDPRSRSSVEMQDAAARPSIADDGLNLTDYDVVFLGFPIWWYEAPRIIQTFLESHDFSGKEVIPFATSGGSGMGDTEDILRRSCSLATRWHTGCRFSGDAGLSGVRDWVRTLEL